MKNVAAEKDRNNDKLFSTLHDTLSMEQKMSIRAPSASWTPVCSVYRQEVIVLLDYFGVQSHHFISSFKCHFHSKCEFK